MSTVVVERTQLVAEAIGEQVHVSVQQTPVKVEIAAVGPQGPAGIAQSFTHTQSPAAAQWTINHNLGARPVVELFDTGGAEIEAEVVHTSVNQAIAYFNVPLAGTAKCI
jgi:dihydroxyacetone kinase DhaKLM complex PTS-EIIA-like component DhaM